MRYNSRRTWIFKPVPRDRQDAVRPGQRRHPYTLGARMLARFRDLAHPDAADRFSTVQEAASRMAGSLSFALLATCLGVCALLVAVMIHVFG